MLLVEMQCCHWHPLLYRVSLRDTLIFVIKSFRHKGLKAFFESGSKAGIQPHQADKLNRQLTALNQAALPEQMDVPGWKLHSLGGDLKGHWSVWVNGNWRITFTFDGQDAVLVDYQDYH
jgi:proteic killer suppression protein